jgi:hydrogenase-4 component E
LHETSLAGETGMNTTLFAQLSTLMSSIVLLFGITLLWRRSLPAYIDAFRWQSAVLAALFVLIGYFEDDPELYFVAAAFFILKVIILPVYLRRLQRRVKVDNEIQPYVNVATSLILAGLLVLLAYAVTRPLVTVSTLPTRGGLPLAMGLIFVGLFVVVTRKKALTQIVGFLVMENGIALLAALGTFGVPFIIELGVFLDVLMGFLVMQVFVYHIYGTFESIDVNQLSELKH